jgi:RNA polymerase sigma factor (sigma-70 family)
MNDGPTAAYARIYEEQQPRLVAYARSLTRNTWVAEDLVAEAHFRVWRRLSAGHEIDNVPAYLMTTVKHLASAAGAAVRETPRDPQADERAGADPARPHGDDPAEQVSSTDLLVRVLEQLPERWVKALWLAEAEGLPLAAIGPQLGTKQGATAVLLHRAREGMRQAFLRAQTGVPDDPACQVHWARMPAYVRGGATGRQSERLLGHVDACDDCRARLAALMRANDRLPALVAPALLVFVLGGAGKFLLAFGAGSAGAVTAVGGHGGGLLHGVRHAAVGASKTQVAAGVGAAVAGAVAVIVVLGGPDSAEVPVAKGPVAEVPVSQAPVASVPGPGKPAKTPGGDDTARAPAPDGSATAVPPAVLGDTGPATVVIPVGNTTPTPVPTAPVEPPTPTPTPAPTPPVTTEPEPTPTDPTPTDPAPSTPVKGTPEPTTPEPTTPSEPAPSPTPSDSKPVGDPVTTPTEPEPSAPVSDEPCRPAEGDQGDQGGQGDRPRG